MAKPYFNEIKILLFCIIREKIKDQKIIKSLLNTDQDLRTRSLKSNTLGVVVLMIY